MAIVDKVAGLSDDAYRYLMGLMSAAKRTPVNARQADSMPAMFRPKPAEAGALPTRDAATGRMAPVPREYTPAQTYGSRAVIAAPAAGAGAAGMSFLPQRRSDDTMGAEIPRGAAQEPGYEGAGARQMSGASLAAQPEPGYTGAGGDMMAPPMPPSRPNAVEIAKLIAMQDRAPAASAAREPEAAAAAPMDKERLWEEYNRSMQDDGGGSAAAFARADRGRASGGSANSHSGGSSGGGRDAALHKALEIIQNLLMHRR